MNVLFTVMFIVCAARLIFLAPQEFLPALLSSASSAATLCLALLSSYCVFCGLSALWEDSGVASALSGALKRPVRALFRSEDPRLARCVCMNVSANLLGLGAIATPYGVQAAKLLDEESKPLYRDAHADEAASNAGKKRREYSMAVLFTLNAASLQIIPTSVIALRTSVGSASPSSVVLPIVLSSLFFLAVSLPATVLFYRPKKAPRTFAAKKNSGKIPQPKTLRSAEK
ncbi:MAG: hypothetical protein ACI4RO_01070 [Candidatus Scatosoma sp.]